MPSRHPSAASGSLGQPAPRAGRPDPELAAALRPLARRWRRIDAREALLRLGWIGPAAACLIALSARARPLPVAHLWSLGLALALPLGIVLLAYLRRPSTVQLARRADRDLALQDRVSTALYLGPVGPDDDEPRASSEIDHATRSALHRRQRRDALEQLAAIDPRRDLPRRAPRRGLLAAALLAALALGLHLLPNPRSAELDRRAAVRQAAERSAERLAGVREAAVLALEASTDAEATSAAGDPMPAESTARAGLESSLRRLESELAASRGRAEDDLAALARAEAELGALRDPAGLGRARRAEDLLADLDALAAALDGREPSEADPSDAAEAIAERLARGLEQASAAERAALAEALAEQADRLPPDLDAAAEALRQAAEAAKADGPEAAAEAAGRAAEAAREARAAAEPARQVEGALDALDEARREIAAAHARPEELLAGGGTGQAGAGQGPDDQGAGDGAGRLGSEASGLGRDPADAAGGEAADGDSANAGDNAADAEVDDQGLRSPAIAPNDAGADTEAGESDESGEVDGEDPTLLPAADERLPAPGPRPLVTAVPRFIPTSGNFDPDAPSTGRQPLAPGQSPAPAAERPLIEALPEYRQAAVAALAREALPAGRREYVRAYFEALAR